MLEFRKSTRRSILAVAGSILVIAFGSFLLYLALPHDDPWRMTHIEVRFWEIPHLNVRFPFVQSTREVPTYPFLGTIALLSISLLFLSRLGRHLVRWVFQNKLQTLGYSLWFLVFIMTFVPGVKVGGIYSRPVSISLLIGLLGVLSTAGGLISLLQHVELKQKLLSVLTTLYEPIRKAIFRSPIAVFLTIVFLLFFTAANLISHFVFEHIPHVQDSIAQVFHAKILAQGSLTAESPPLREFFEFTHVINNGKWYSQYPPGHIVLLVPALLLGVPWIVNPLLGSLTVVLLYFLGRELYSDSIGRVSALLGLGSQFLLFMSSEFMNHATALFFFTLFLYFVARVVKSGNVWHAIAAGGALGWMLNTRPLTAAGVVVPFALYGLAIFVPKRKEYRWPVVGFTISFAVFVAALLVFNKLTNGDPFLFGFQVLYGDEVLPGFGHAAWGTPHSLLRGMHQTLDNLLGLNKYLFEWPIPSLLFVFLFLGSLKARMWDYLLIGSVFSLAGAYVFYWYQDWCFGPRFLYETSVPLILLTARGIDFFPMLLQSGFKERGSLRSAYATTAFCIFLLFGVGGAINLPRHLEVYGDAYWGVSANELKIVEKAGLRKAVVIMKDYYGRVFLANQPDLSNDVVFVRDRNRKNAALKEHFEGYSFYTLKNGILQAYDPNASEIQ
jgi:hypothetical protein